MGACSQIKRIIPAYLAHKRGRGMYIYPLKKNFAALLKTKRVVQRRETRPEKNIRPGEHKRSALSATTTAPTNQPSTECVFLQRGTIQKRANTRDKGLNNRDVSDIRGHAWLHNATMGLGDDNNGNGARATANNGLNGRGRPLSENGRWRAPLCTNSTMIATANVCACIWLYMVDYRCVCCTASGVMC
jgi:hypothetical protein